MRRLTKTHGRMPYIVSFMLGLVLLASGAAAAEQHPPAHARNAFMLGFVYGNAHNIYSQNRDLQGDAGELYNKWMSDARQYADTLGISVDTNPPPYNPSSPSPQTDIIRAGRGKADLLLIQLQSKHKLDTLSALELGYKSAIAIEFVPYLDAAGQEEIARGYENLAVQARIPARIVQKYIDTLRRTRERQAVVEAMFTFKSEVLNHYEGLTMTTLEGTRRQLNIWSMGWSLGLATLGQTRGADPATVARIFEKCRTYADVLGISLPMLPEATTDSANDTANAIHYLLNEAGDTVGGELNSKYGPRSSALFELAIKSMLALLLYAAEDDMSQTLAGVIDRSGGKAGLPGFTYQPVVDKMHARVAYDSVREEIIAMDVRIRQYLMARQN